MPDRMFANLERIDHWVYHYTRGSTALDKILPSGQLRMSPFAQMNDPRETKEWFYSMSLEKDLQISTPDFFALSKKASDLAKSLCKIFCVTCDHEVVLLDDIDAVFYRGFGHSRMWAQYADNHRGVCLIFDKSQLHAAINSVVGIDERLYMGPVHYTNWSTDDTHAFHLSYRQILDSSLENIVEQKIDQYRNSYYFTKVSDWSSEVEWRWVIRTQDDQPRFFSFGHALEGIVLGMDFPIADIPKVQAYCANNDIEISRTHWQNGHLSMLPVV